MKKWFTLFAILLFPYLIVQVIEKATHNILTLGYLEKEIISTDDSGKIYQEIDSVKVPSFKLLNQDGEYVSNLDLMGYNYIVNFFLLLRIVLCFYYCNNQLIFSFVFKTVIT